ncbi:MAG: LVIVD repeat-containing protein [Haloferacaceae archaeon]
MYRRDVVRAAGGVLTARAAGVLGRATAATEPPDFGPLARIDVEGVKEAVVGADGRVAYLAVTDGYAVVDLAVPESPRVLAERRGLLADRSDGPLEEIYDVKIDGDRLLVVGPSHGGPDLHAAVIVDVSDPATPRRVAVFETAHPIHNCDLAGGYAYLVQNDGDRNPLLVVDVGGDDPVEVARWSLLDAADAWERVAPALRPLHDVSVRDGVACLAHWDAGTWLLDVSNPASPSVLGHAGGRDPDSLAGLDRQGVRRERLTPPGNAHYATLDESGTLLAVGGESWGLQVDGDVVGGPSGVDLWDVSAPGDPAHLATVDPPTTTDPTRDGVWTTAHNFDIRGDVLYAAWYDGGVTRHDVSDPSRPTRTAGWRDPATARFWTAQAAAPGECFVASDMGRAGDGDGAEFFTFPDRAGEQSNPPTRGATRSETPGATTARTPARTRTTTRTGTPSTRTAESSHSPATSVRTGSPELGVGALLAALAAVAVWLRRRERP